MKKPLNVWSEERPGGVGEGRWWYAGGGHLEEYKKEDWSCLTQCLSSEDIKEYDSKVTLQRSSDNVV